MTLEDAPVFDDSRGSLLAVELAEVPFPVRRVFVVTGRAGGVDRGDHAVPCGQRVVLLSGTACFRTVPAGGLDAVETHLERRGQRLDLHPGDHVRYRLADEHSVVMVLAEEPYRADG